jgi:excisionase family DNA binding protein
VSGLPDVLTPREIAERERLSYHAVLRAIRRGELRAYQRGNRLRIDRDDYLAWRTARPAQRERPQPAETPPRRSPRRRARGGSVAQIEAMRGRA